MQRTHVFPNTRTEAQYDGFTQSIELLYMKRRDLKKVMENPLALENIKHFRTIIHEICHFYDNISTLRGIEFLTSIYDAYNSLTLPTNREREMPRVINSYNLYRRMRTEDYYKTIDREVYSSKLEDIKRWSFSQTVGLKFNNNGKIDANRPILFNRFTYDGQSVARIPFSIESLWEINAVACEIEYNYKSIHNSNVEETEKRIYLDLLQKDSIKWIYNTDLLIYSAPVHIVSNKTHFGELYGSYKLASIISNISLNLPSKYYSLIKKPKVLQDRIEKIRFNGFIRQKEPAFIYLCILHNVIEAIYAGSINHWKVEDILKASQLPEKKIIEDEIVKEVEKLKRDKITGVFDQEYMDIINLGIELFLKRGLGGDHNFEKLTYVDIEKLPIICEDEVFEETKLIQRVEALSKMKDRIFEFARACGY
jgi:hypothetical protein